MSEGLRCSWDYSLSKNQSTRYPSPHNLPGPLSKEINKKEVKRSEIVPHFARRLGGVYKRSRLRRMVTYQ